MMMSEVRVREAEQGDVKAVFALMQEAAPAMHQELHPSITPQALKEFGWGDKQLFRAFLAEEINESGEVKGVVGFALSHHLYSTWEGFSSCLRHLYVAPTHRRHGIGTRLWRAAVRASLDEGCIRCECFVPESNAEGLQYCLKVGKMQDLTASGEIWHLFAIDGETFSTYPHCVKQGRSSVRIRPATGEDFTGVEQLIQYLADYEEMPDGPKLDAKTLRYHAVERNTPWCMCWVAEDIARGGNSSNTGERKSGPIVGYVIYLYLMSFEGCSVYMEDLFVMPSYRGQGIGQSLWSIAIQDGLKNGARRCEFAVLKENTPSIGFYKSKGAIDLTEEKGYHLLRMQHAQMVKFVEKA